MSNRPNILFVMTDQQRFDALGCMGHPLVRTPHLDALADEAVLFTDAYTPSPVCGPARAALFSGQYPPGCGVVGNWVPFNGQQTLLSEHLQDLGYHTAVVGKLHFVPHDQPYGFEHRRINDVPGNIYANDAAHSDYVRYLGRTIFAEDPDEPIRRFDADECQYPAGDLKRFIMGTNFVPESHHITPWTTRESIEFLSYRWDQRRPFFLFTSYFGPHQPFAVPEPWANEYCAENIDLPAQFYADMRANPVFQETKAGQVSAFQAQLDENDYRTCLAAYYANITMIDYFLGQLFEYLRRNELWENTMIVFCSDHGDHAARHRLFFKGDMYDGAVRVPLLIKPPGGKSWGGRCTRVVSTLDLYGTVLDVAGHDDWRSPEVEAESLLPVLKGGAKNTGEAYAIHGSCADNNLTMLRRGAYKLIRLARQGREPVYELYDMRDPITEVRDLHAKAEYAAAGAAMRKDLDAWWAGQRSRYPNQISSYAVRSD